MTRVKMVDRFLLTIGLGAVSVCTVIPFNVAALCLWSYCLIRWVKDPAVRNGRRNGKVEVAGQILCMVVIFVAAELAPCKTVDRVKSRPMILAREAFTLGGLQEARMLGLIRLYPYDLGAPDELTGQVVRFPSRELTVGEFIATIEKQTPLRHRFRSCGNSTTVLWGEDCGGGLSIDLPIRHPF